MTGISVIDDIISQLTVISHISEDQKINTTDGQVIINENGYIENLCRWKNGENRDKNIQFISKIIKQAYEIIKTTLNSNYLNIYDNSTKEDINTNDELEYKKNIGILDLISTKLAESIIGIQNIKKTYFADKSTVAKIETIIKNIEREINEVSHEMARLHRVKEEYFRARE